MNKPSAFLVSLNTVKNDVALQPGNRGARKWPVTEPYPQKERIASEVVVQPPQQDEKCPVLVMPNTEVAVFTEEASQDRHYHEKGTEIYMPIEGTVGIEVEWITYQLVPGDMIAVNPGSWHQVRSEGCKFLCRVVTVDCGGTSDKFVC